MISAYLPGFAGEGAGLAVPPGEAGPASTISLLPAAADIGNRTILSYSSAVMTPRPDRAVERWGLTTSLGATGAPARLIRGTESVFSGGGRPRFGAPAQVGAPF